MSTSVPHEERSAIADMVASIFRDLRRSIPDEETICHYTDSAGLYGILREGRLRATYIAFLNDASEYQHSVEMLHAEVRQQRGIQSAPDVMALLARMDELLRITAPSNFYPIFVTCFSAAENDLSQWRAYGGGEGGYSIGFRAEALRMKAITFGAGLYPVVYHEDRQRDTIRSALIWALNEYPKTAQQCSPSTKQEHLESWLATYFEHLVALAPIFKNRAFSDEREWRLVYRLAHWSMLRFIPKRDYISGYVELQLGIPQVHHPAHWFPDDPGRAITMPPKLPIAKVWVGPGKLNELSEVSVRHLCRNNGYPDSELEIRRSQIPFRVAQ